MIQSVIATTQISVSIRSTISDSQDTINADTEITYVVVDGGEITVDDVIYRVSQGNNRGSCTKSRNNECSNW